MKNIKTMSKKDLTKLLNNKLINEVDIYNRDEIYHIYTKALLITETGRVYEILPEKTTIKEHDKPEEIIKVNKSIEEQIAEIPKGIYEIEFVKTFGSEKMGKIKLI